MDAELTRRLGKPDFLGFVKKFPYEVKAEMVGDEPYFTCSPKKSPGKPPAEGALFSPEEMIEFLERGFVDSELDGSLEVLFAMFWDKQKHCKEKLNTLAPEESAGQKRCYLLSEILKKNLSKAIRLRTMQVLREFNQKVGDFLERKVSQATEGEDPSFAGTEEGSRTPQITLHGYLGLAEYLGLEPNPN